ncbi:hypothetical protein BRC83_07500 [Halobacteriales archaeon QS_1_68_17]|nr:MAG: hypothetical protein BRC83_07500 [Halobacteriales archaeon QS_1_68_17]
MGTPAGRACAWETRPRVARPIQHDLVDLPADAHRVGIARRPPGWFHGYVDENIPELGPPDDLLDDFHDRIDELTFRGVCEESAHNAAWDEVDYERRYHDDLDADSDARAAMARLVDRVESGETVVLVILLLTSLCYLRRQTLSAWILNSSFHVLTATSIKPRLETRLS